MSQPEGATDRRFYAEPAFTRSNAKADRDKWVAFAVLLGVVIAFLTYSDSKASERAKSIANEVVKPIGDQVITNTAQVKNLMMSVSKIEINTKETNNLIREWISKK